MKKFTINASGKKLGRIASEAAGILMGKKTPTTVRNEVPDVTVLIEKAGELDLGERRLASITHTRYSGHPGGLTIIRGDEILKKKGVKTLLTHAIEKMIPRNKLHKIRMQRLTIEE